VAADGAAAMVAVGAPAADSGAVGAGVKIAGFAELLSSANH